MMPDKHPLILSTESRPSHRSEPEMATRFEEEKPVGSPRNVIASFPLSPTVNNEPMVTVMRRGSRGQQIRLGVSKNMPQWMVNRLIRDAENDQVGGRRQGDWEMVPGYQARGGHPGYAAVIYRGGEGGNSKDTSAQDAVLPRFGRFPRTRELREGKLEYIGPQPDGSTLYRQHFDWVGPFEDAAQSVFPTGVVPDPNASFSFLPASPFQPKPNFVAPPGVGGTPDKKSSLSRDVVSALTGESAPALIQQENLIQSPFRERQIPLRGTGNFILPPEQQAKVKYSGNTFTTLSREAAKKIIRRTLPKVGKNGFISQDSREPTLGQKFKNFWEYYSSQAAANEIFSRPASQLPPYPIYRSKEAYDAAVKQGYDKAILVLRRKGITPYKNSKGQLVYNDHDPEYEFKSTYPFYAPIGEVERLVEPLMPVPGRAEGMPIDPLTLAIATTFAPVIGPGGDVYTYGVGAGKNYLQGAAAQGIKRYSKTAIAEDPPEGVLNNVFDIGLNLFHKGDGTAGADAVARNTGGKRIGEQVSDLGENTPWGMAYNAGVQFGLDPTNIFLAPANAKLLMNPYVVQLFRGSEAAAEAAKAVAAAKAAQGPSLAMEVIDATKGLGRVVKAAPAIVKAARKPTFTPSLPEIVHPADIIPDGELIMRPGQVLEGQMTAFTQGHNPLY